MTTDAQKAVALIAAMAAENEEFAKEIASGLYYVSILGRENPAKFMYELAKLARKYGAVTEKRYVDNDFHIDVLLEGMEAFSIFTPRKAVCEARVVGTEEVEVPDFTAVPTKKVQRDVIEWDCHPLLESIGDD